MENLEQSFVTAKKPDLLEVFEYLSLCRFDEDLLSYDTISSLCALNQPVFAYVKIRNDLFKNDFYRYDMLNI